MCVKIGSVSAIGDGVASGEAVADWNERDAQETPRDASTSARRVRAPSAACLFTACDD